MKYSIRSQVMMAGTLSYQFWVFPHSHLQLNFGFSLSYVTEHFQNEIDPIKVFLNLFLQINKAKDMGEDLAGQATKMGKGAVNQAQAVGGKLQKTGMGAINKAKGAGMGAINQAKGAGMGALNQAKGAGMGMINQAKNTASRSWDAYRMFFLYSLE